MMICSDLIKQSITNSPKLSKHSKERALERFNMTAKEFGDYVMKNHRKFEYITTSYGYGGKPSRLFIFDGKAFVFSLNTNEIITTYPIDDKKCTDQIKRISNRVGLIMKKEVESIERREQRKLNAIQRFQAELEKELYELRTMFTKSRSFAKKLAIKARITAVELRILELPEEESNIKIGKLREVQSILHVTKEVGGL